MTDKPNLPGYNVSDVTQVDAGGKESTAYESYWAYLKSEDAPVDEPHMHNAKQIEAWAKAANPKNVSKVGQDFLDFHDALTKLNFSASSGSNGQGLDLTDLIRELGKELHDGWHGEATAAPEAQRQLTLLYQSAKDLMSTAMQAGYAVKGHGDHALPTFTKAFTGDDMDKDADVYIEGDWKRDNRDNYPALQGMNHTSQDEVVLSQAQRQAMTIYQDQWAQKKLAAHNTDVTTSYDSLPYMLDLSFPPGTEVPKPPPPPKDTTQHGPPDNKHGDDGGSNTVPSFHGGSGGGVPHMPSSSNLAGLGNTGNGSGTNLSGVGHRPTGTDLSGIGNDGIGGGPSGTSLGGAPGGTSLGQGGTGLGNGPGGTGLGSNPPGFPSAGPIGLGGGGGGGGFGGLPKGGLGGSVQEAGTIGARGAVNGAAAAEEAAMGNAAANAARGGGMMPMMPPMAGQGGQKEGRERGTWLTEDEDVWGADDDVAPPLIG